MAQAAHLDLRLFLEGVEVPVISASIQIAANAPASASIQVIATDKILDLLPRTVVHLFFYDYIGAGHVAIDQKRAQLSQISFQDWINEKYKLLFMGELVTIKFQKSHDQRAVILECADFSNYWDTTFQYNFGGSLFAGRRKAAFIGANSNFFTSILGHGVGTVSNLLNGKSVNYPNLKGLLAGVVRMLEAIGGSYYGTNVFRGCNDFTSIAELRLKILQQITAAEADTSTSRLFARKAFNMWMNRATQGLGKLISFRGLVKTCFKFIFHEVYPCPVAKYVPSSSETVRRRRYLSPPEVIVKGANDIIERIDRTNNILSRFSSTAPFGEQVEVAKAYHTSHENLYKEFKTFYASAGAGISGPTTKRIAQDLSNAFGPLRLTHKIIRSGDFLQVLNAKHSELQRHYNSAKSALRRLVNQRHRVTETRVREHQARVNNQIFRPDIWYSAPPRCNVLFPDLYDSFSWARQYLREVSRLELQTHNEILGNDALFNGRYYAPNVEDVRRGTKLSSRRFARTIMDHELFTGIIPMFESMTEANLFAMRSSAVQKQGSPVPYAQRAVNFQYFKYKFESRMMSASGRFNPMFVAGFPALIIDRPMTEENLQISSLPVGDQIRALNITAEEEPTRSDLLRSLVGPQYLGVPASLSHNVSQGGGRTDYQFIHARVHRESTEFLGVDQVEWYKVVATRDKKKVVAYPITFPPRRGQLGPSGGTISRVVDVTSSKSGKTLPVLGTNIKARVGTDIPPFLIKEITTQIKRSIPAYANSPFFKQLIGLDDFLEDSSLRLGAFEVHESVPYRKKQNADLPIEEAIRPPWIWDGWAVPKITETYDQLFGTGAITDIDGYGILADASGSSSRTQYLTVEERLAAEQQNRAASSGSTRRSPAAGRSERDVEITRASRYQAALLLLETEKTIENSIDFLVRSYSFVKVNNMDVGEFLKAYNWRPVATMVDILGGADLSIKQTEVKATKMVRRKYVKRKGRTVVYRDANGAITDTAEEYPVYGTRYVEKPIKRIGYVVDGTEGFHSRAFGDVEDLFGLVSPTVTRVLGLSSNSSRKIAARMDVRKRRRAVVKTYVAELTGSKGLVG